MGCGRREEGKEAFYGEEATETCESNIISRCSKLNRLRSLVRRILRYTEVIEGTLCEELAIIKVLLMRCVANTKSRLLNRN